MPHGDFLVAFSAGTGIIFQSMNNGSSISVVIPVFQSEPALSPLLDRLVKTLSAMHADYEVIFVNDGSTDNSWGVISSFVEQHPEHVRGINLSRNFGQHNALLCGMRSARKDIIVTIDDDLQHAPEDIPLLVGKLDEGLDVVYGVARSRRHAPMRVLLSWFLRLVVKIVMGNKIAFDITSFRAFRNQFQDLLESYNAPMVFIDVLLAWTTSRFGAVAVEHHPRRFGKSNYSWRRLFFQGVTVLISFSTVPLRLASWIGFFFTLFGVGVLVYVVGMYLILGYSFPGFPFLASTIAIFAGAQLFALGIMGEYLARIYFRMMDKPPYIIRQTTDHAFQT